MSKDFSFPADIDPHVVLATMRSRHEVGYHGRLTEDTSSRDRYRLCLPSTMRTIQRVALWMTENLEPRQSPNYLAPCGVKMLKTIVGHAIGEYVSIGMMICAAQSIGAPAQLISGTVALGFTSDSIRRAHNLYKKEQQ